MEKNQTKDIQKELQGELQKRARLNDTLDSLLGDFWGLSQQISKEVTKDIGMRAEKKAQQNKDSLEMQREAFEQEIREKTNADLKKETEDVQAAVSEEEKTKEQEIPQTDPMEDLMSLTGLTELKKDVEDLINLVKMQKMRQEKGMKIVPVSLHLVFTGNPGTGKTTVARILARLYKQIGVLKEGQLVEVDRSGLVAGFVGQTATKTQEKIKEAMGGILFIDEAYTLAKSEANDFGQEAIDTILKAMEDNRDNFVVIVAGYPDLMKKFINSNPGLKSRFNKYFYFPDYTPEELIVIFEGFCRKYQYSMDEEAKEVVIDKIRTLEAQKDDNFANAREMRNLFEQIITRQANRVARMEQPQEADILTIKKEDIP